MKSILLSFMILCMALVGFAQTRSLPSSTFEKAQTAVQSGKAVDSWDLSIDFQGSVIPTDIILENVDSLSDHPDVAFITGLNFYSEVWLLLQFSGTQNNWAGSNSYFDPPGQADRWMIIPDVPVTSNAVLRWKGISVSFSSTGGTHESYEIYIASGAAASHSDFTNAPIYTESAEDSTWASHEVSLSSWAGDTVSIAFRHTSNNQQVLGIDDILVGTAPVQQGSVTGTFEAAGDFSLDLSPWITLDMDSSVTYGISGIAYIHKNEPTAFMAFNPVSTVPTLGTSTLHTGGGDKYGACFAAVTGPNNDWLISPKVIISDGGSVRFYARSYSMNYGKERFRVLVSTGNPEPPEFSVVSPSPYVEVDTAWTMFEYSLSNWSNQNVHVAIQCVSDNSFIFLIDNIEIDTVGHVGIIEPVESKIKLFPNPASETLTIENAGTSSVEIYNLEGRLIRKEDNIPASWRLSVSDFPVGIYRARILSREGIETIPFVIVR